MFIESQAKPIETNIFISSTFKDGYWKKENGDVVSFAGPTG
jgi:hypothetical protein